MNHKRRVAKIVEELINYFYKIDVVNIHLDIIDNNEMFTIVFNCEFTCLKKEDIDFLVKNLSCEKQEEIEEYYWELTGESDEELSIIGMMIDQFEINVKDNVVELILYRRK